MPLRILKLIISIFYRLNILILNIFTKKRRQQGIILLYHSIPDKYKLRFKKQLKLIKKYSHPVSANFISNNEIKERYVAITFDDGHKNILQNVFPEIQKEKIPITLFIPSGFVGKPPGWYSKERNIDDGIHLMSSKELFDINKSQLVSIGSHSVTHPYLTDLKENEIKNEIFQSKNDLEQILNEIITLFSFPHGEYDNNIVSFCKQAGYTYVFSILPVPIDFKKDEYIRGRIDVDPWDWTLEFYLKLVGAYCWLPRAFEMKRRVLSFIKSGFSIE